MYRKGRDAVQEFDPDERLFRRCVLEEVAGNRLLPGAISYKNMSVNRERFGPPEDVTFDAPGHGIARFVVQHIPSNVEGEGGGKPFSFRPAHVPLEDNYAHSEIWAYKDGVRVEKPSPSDAVKKRYRLIMSDHSLVILDPQV